MLRMRKLGSTGHGLESCMPCCRAQPRCASVTKQYNLVPYLTYSYGAVQMVKCSCVAVVVCATYCAVASLVLVRRLHSVLAVCDIELIRHWCVSQFSDFQHVTHANRPSDCSSAFCISATLTVSMLPLNRVHCFCQ